MKKLRGIVTPPCHRYFQVQVLGFVEQVQKVVNDNRGFFTSRVFSTYTREGVALLGEGQLPSAIEMAAFSSGFPVGPLAVLDEVSLALSHNDRRNWLGGTVSDLRLPASCWKRRSATKHSDLWAVVVRPFGKGVGIIWEITIVHG